MARVNASLKAQNHWKNIPLHKRMEVVENFMSHFGKNTDSIAKDITQSMGKPLGQAKGEVGGLFSRTKALLELAPAALQDDHIQSAAGFRRKLAREPVGVVAVIAPWNYPLLTAGNGVIPAVLAGNGVALKHSPRTPLVADAFEKAFLEAGAPEGLVCSLPVSHEVFADTVVNPAIGFVQFTGSVQGGKNVYSTVSQRRFIDVGLELGGKDAFYVAEDADVDNAVANAVDGAFYNAGQSCCAVERVYVHASLYDRFIEKAIPLVNSYVQGDPLNNMAVSMGPMALPGAPKFLQLQVEDAVKKGAKLLSGGQAVTDSAGKGRFFQPTLLADVNHTMSVMKEENFGPILSIMKVANDTDAIAKINDCQFGLTASIWTNSPSRCDKMAPQIEAGTVFMNRCDFLDPQLAWSGWKNTGKGVGLSKHCFSSFTRLKSYHFKTQ